MSAPRQKRIRSLQVYAITALLKPINPNNDWEEHHFIASGQWLRSNHGWYSQFQEYAADGDDKFRLEDGHFPAHQPQVNGLEAAKWVIANPYSKATFVT